MRPSPLFLASLLALGGCTSALVDVFTSTPSTSTDFAPAPSVGQQYDPAVVTQGTGLVLAWCEVNEAGQAQAWVGALVDGGVRIEGAMVLSGSEMHDPRLFGRRSGWLLSVQPLPYSLSLLSVDPFGRAGRASPLTTPGAQSDFSAVAVGDGLFAGWTAYNNGYDVWLGVVDETNTVQDAGALTGAGYQFRPAVTRVGDALLVVWEEFSSVQNDADDVVGQWVGGARFSFPLVNEQSSPRVAGGESVALLAWRDFETRSVQVARVRPDGTKVDLQPITLGFGDGVAVSRSEQGFVAAFNGQRNGVDWVRVVPIAESGAVRADAGVWLFEGASVASSRLSLDARLLAFTRRDADGGSSVHVRRIGPRAVGDECVLGEDCLTGRCERGSCLE